MSYRSDPVVVAMRHDTTAARVGEEVTAALRAGFRVNIITAGSSRDLVASAFPTGRIVFARHISGADQFPSAAAAAAAITKWAGNHTTSPAWGNSSLVHARARRA